mmetsp:Transcript_46332/g.53694  ORF Transcript_46332/g.53694 Transcript_46332/m.53694 type:complete len:539 (+) Transcript_46332:19-1635(+)
MGRKIKKGVKGEVSQYITRSKAIRKLQVSLKDFRRLCILKGIYPREPKKKFEGNTKTYYHVKDINFLAHDQLLDKFREIATTLRKHRKALRKDDKDKAQRIKENIPKYTLNHVIKERYPTFVDALRDLDDPLSLMNLFAAFPAHHLHGIPSHKVQMAIRLSREFNYYVIKSHSLRKVFLSIKGIYYQAEAQGQAITWITPYFFTQKMPIDLDYKVMITFLEFYEALMKFVNFKLYKSIGLAYPPKVDVDLVNAQAFSYKAMIADNLHTDIEQKMQSLDDQKYQISKEFEQDQEVKKINEKYQTSGSTLFKKLVFFLNREVPKYSLEFVIQAFGGEVLWDTDDVNIDDERITHVVTDRDPSQLKMNKNKEYVQPQWVYDSVNNKILLPVQEYAPGKILPPHLSPFVDSKEEGGYKPQRQKDLEKLKGEMEPEEDEDLEEGKDGDMEEEEEDEEETQQFDAERKLDQLRKLEKREQKERKELGQTVMGRKKKRLYDKIAHARDQTTKKGEKLREKRDKLAMKERKKAKGIEDDDDSSDEE